MNQSRAEADGPPSTEMLAELAGLDAVHSALLLESSGRIRERAGAGDPDGLRRAATLATAVHASAAHLGEATGTGDVSAIVIPARDRAVWVVPVPTRGVPLLLLLVCGAEAELELEERLEEFLERMREDVPTPGSATEDLEASLLEGLERLFPRTDESVE